MGHPVEFENYRLSVTGVPAVACPSKWSAANARCASGWFSWSLIVSAPCSTVQCRLVKKLPGQPPSGSIEPSCPPGAPAKFIPQDGALGADKIQRPVMITSGVGAAAGVAPPIGLPAQPATINATRTPPATRIVGSLKAISFWLESEFALTFCLSMILSENRFSLFGIMLQAHPHFMVGITNS